MSGFTRELMIAKLAVQRAARLTRLVAETGFQAITKEDHSPVTVADFAAQALIISAIRHAFPKDHVVGEEDSDKLRSNQSLSNKVWGFIQTILKQSTEEEINILGDIKSENEMLDLIDFGKYEGGKGSRFWALDPIDGTKGFLRREQYAVCLALLDETAKVQVGVIGCPNLKYDNQDHSAHAIRGGLFAAIRGQGAFVEILFNEKTTAKIADHGRKRIAFNENVKKLSDASFCESVEPGHSSLNKQQAIANELGIIKPPVKMDSQAKYCSISRGDGEIYLRLPVSSEYQEKIWDHAPGSLLVEEAGGVISDCHGRELDFSQGRTLKENSGIVAASSQLYSDVIAVVADVQESDNNDSSGRM